MTPQEVIKQLDMLICNEKVLIGCSSMGELQHSQNIEALEIAKQAVEKQIPKKPSYEGDGYDDKGNLIYDTAYCPKCNKEFEVYYYSGKCCNECGQALDRSNE